MVPNVNKTQYGTGLQNMYGILSSVVDPEPEPKLFAGAGMINFGPRSDSLQCLVTKIA